MFLSNLAHSFENVCEIILESEGIEKSLTGAVYEQEKEETETKRVSGDLAKLKQIFEQSSSTGHYFSVV